MSQQFNNRMKRLPTKAEARAQLKRLNVASLTAPQVQDALRVAQMLGLIHSPIDWDDSLARQQLQCVQRGL